MGFYRIQYTRKAARNLRALPSEVSKRFMDAFASMACGQGRWDIKKLTGQSGHRLRIGRYRAIFEKDGTTLTIVVIEVGTRGDIYQ
jgi:mRNA interferase RelE/StbE